MARYTVIWVLAVTFMLMGNEIIDVRRLICVLQNRQLDAIAQKRCKKLT